MTIDCVSRDTLEETGETAEQWFTRIAREKPPTLVPCKGCYYCGQDHRGPAQYWPAEELQRHNDAVDEYNRTL